MRLGGSGEERQDERAVIGSSFPLDSFQTPPNFLKTLAQFFQRAVRAGDVLADSTPPIDRRPHRPKER